MHIALLKPRSPPCLLNQCSLVCCLKQYFRAQMASALLDPTCTVQHSYGRHLDIFKLVFWVHIKREDWYSINHCFCHKPIGAIFWLLKSYRLWLPPVHDEKLHRPDGYRPKKSVPFVLRWNADLHPSWVMSPGHQSLCAIIHDFECWHTQRRPCLQNRASANTLADVLLLSQPKFVPPFSWFLSLGSAKPQISTTHRPRHRI